MAPAAAHAAGAFSPDVVHSSPLPEIAQSSASGHSAHAVHSTHSTHAAHAAHSNQPDPSDQSAPSSSPLLHGLAPGARRLLKLAVAALARREHSRSEIESKLARRLLPEESPQDLASALSRLQAHGLLSDRRMAESLVRTRAHRYGRLRIAQELDRRGVDRDTIAATLPAEADDALRAQEIWRRRFGTAAASPQERARQMRYLLARGYSARVVARVLRAGADEVDAAGGHADPEAECGPGGHD